jgi:hypothetical protein
MYAARVSGSEILADQKLRLWSALARHTLASGARRKQLREALAQSVASSPASSMSSPPLSSS